MASPVVRGIKGLPSLGIRNCDIRGVGPKRADPGWSIGPWPVKVRTVSSPRLAVIDGVQGVLVAVSALAEFCNGPTDIADESR